MSAHLDLRSRVGSQNRRRRLRESENAIEGRAQRSRSEVLTDRLDRAEAHAADIARLAGERQARLDAARTRAEDIVLEWDGHRSAGSKSAIRARQKAEAARTERPADARRLTSADASVETALRRIVDSQQDLEHDELVDIAEQIAHRITSTADGRLPYNRIEAATAGMHRGTRRSPAVRNAIGSLRSRTTLWAAPACASTPSLKTTSR